MKGKCLEIGIEKWNFSWNSIESNNQQHCEILVHFSFQIEKLLHFSAIHLDQKFRIFIDKMQSYMHNFTLSFSEKEWSLKCFHSFREWKVKWKCLKVEIENKKWNWNTSRSRSEFSNKSPLVDIIRARIGTLPPQPPTHLCFRPCRHLRHHPVLSSSVFIQSFARRKYLLYVYSPTTNQLPRHQHHFAFDDFLWEPLLKPLWSVGRRIDWIGMSQSQRWHFW